MSNKHSSEKNLVKATCINEETKKRLLKNDIEIPHGEHIKTLYTEPVFKGVMQCHRCKEFGHYTTSCTSSRQERCGKCNNVTHEDSLCPEMSKCRNCTEFHSSYDRKCKTYRSLKDSLIATEMLNMGIHSKRGKNYEILTNKPNDKHKGDFAKVCSFNKDIDDVRKTVDTVQSQMDSCQKKISSQDETINQNTKILNDVSSLLKENKAVLKDIDPKFTATYEIITDETNTKMNALADATNERLNNLEQAMATITNSKFEAVVFKPFQREIVFTQAAGVRGGSKSPFIMAINEKIRNTPKP